MTTLARTAKKPSKTAASGARAGRIRSPGPGEFEIIEAIFAPLARDAAGALGLTDDAALLASAPAMETVVTCDAMVEGVHFMSDDPPGLVGQKLLRVNLSDLAAMGATPVGYVLALMLPRTRDADWLEAFAAGLRADQDAYGITLYGGDTVRTPGPLSLSATAFGHVATGTALLRSGARAGDIIYVSGTIGDGALGLRVLKGEALDVSEPITGELVVRYRRPEPRLELGRRLVGMATAAVDVSDGLVADLAHVCTASGVGAEIRLDEVPLSATAGGLVKSGATNRVDLATGGDDYELLFTVPPALEDAVAQLAGDLGLALTAIGRILVGEGLTVMDGRGHPIEISRSGYTHF